MPKVFISYRREDSAAAAGRIFDKLTSKLGEPAVFFDVNTIPFGTDFRFYIEQILKQCDVLLAIIGDDWLNVAYDDDRRKGQRRLDDPDDFVRAEIELALKNGVTVIPVLVDQARMPEKNALPPTLADLTFLNAAEARSDRDFHNQVDRLIQQIGQCALETSNPDPMDKSLVLQKIWYKQKPLGLADLFPGWKGHKHYDDIGILIISAGKIDFIGKEFQVLIKNVKKLSRGRQGLDINHQWVKIEYEENNQPKVALLANGQYLGVAAMFNQNDQLLESIKGVYGFSDA